MSDLVKSLARAIAPIHSRLVGSTQLPMGPNWLLGRPWHLPMESVDYQQAFRLVPTIQFCVELYQSTLAATPLRFYQGEGQKRVEIERVPGNIVDLWAAANAEQTDYELVEDLVGSLELQGNAYLFKDYMNTQKLRQLWVLNPLTVRPVRGAGRITTHFEVQDGGNTIKVPRAQIVHFRRFDPDMGAVGVSRLTALRLSYESQRDSQRFLRLFYQKGGMVAGHYSTENSLDDDDIERLKEQFKQRYQGVENSWDPVFLPKKLAFTRAGLTMQEMQFVETEKMTAEQMLRLFKIPPMLAGMLDGGTGLNSDVAQVSMMLFLRFGAIPAATRIQKVLNERLLQSGEFGFDISCEFDFSNDPVMVEAYLKQAEMWVKATGAPHMSRAEARARQNMKERPEGEGLDTILQPIGLIESGSEGELRADPAASDNPAGPVKDKPKAPSDDKAKARGLRTHMTRDQMRTRNDRKLRTSERRVESFARRHFRGQWERIRAELKKQDTVEMSRAVDLDVLLSQLHDPSAIRRARSLVSAIVHDAGEAAITDLALDLAFRLDALEVRRFVDQKGAALVTNIDNTTRDKLQKQIGEGLTNGETFSEISARIDGVMRDRLSRAQLIARTETAGAYNHGTVEGYRQSGVVTKKEWLTSGDDNVRDTHRALDGVAVLLDDDFITLTGERLDHPGDPGADISETANCRCTMVAHTDTLAEEQQQSMPSLEEWLRAQQ